MLRDFRVWAARGLTVLGIFLSAGGIFFYGFLASIPGGSGDASPVSIFLLIFGISSLPLGIIVATVGISLQKRMHDEWGPIGFPWHHGLQKWAKCGQCGGLMKADTRICPFCGATRTAQSNTPKPLMGTKPAEAGIKAIVATDKHWKGWQPRPGGKCSVEIVRGHLFLEEPGKDAVLIEPKKVLRTSNLTLLLDTGSWSDGKVTLTFDSASDADTVEQEANKLVTIKK